MRLKSLSVVRYAISALVALLSVTAHTTHAQAQGEMLFFSTDVHSHLDMLTSNINNRCTNGISNWCELIGLVGDYNLEDPNVLVMSLL
jgi:hypothetical protein